jgi:hypothetical protein
MNEITNNIYLFAVTQIRLQKCPGLHVPALHIALTTAHRHLCNRGRGDRGAVAIEGHAVNSVAHTCTHTIALSAPAIATHKYIHISITIDLVTAYICVGSHWEYPQTRWLKGLQWRGSTLSEWCHTRLRGLDWSSLDRH